MPFDGSDFSRFPQPSPPGPSFLAAALAKVQVWLAWVWKALRSFVPVGRHVPERQLYDSAVCWLRTARALIEAEENWTVGTYRTTDGRYCAISALRTAARGMHHRNVRQVAHRYLLAVARERGFCSVEQLNDRSTHAEVLGVFDAACLRLGA